MAFQYNLIQVDGDYLTVDGMVGGSRWMTEVTGLDKLLVNRLSTTDYAIDGAPVKQYSAVKGVPVEIEFDILPPAPMATLIAANNTAEDGDTTLNLVIVGPLGTFDIDVVPDGFEIGGEALEAGVKDAKFRYIVAAVN